MLFLVSVVMMSMILGYGSTATAELGLLKLEAGAVSDGPVAGFGLFNDAAEVTLFGNGDRVFLTTQIDRLLDSGQPDGIFCRDRSA